MCPFFLYSALICSIVSLVGLISKMLGIPLLGESVFKILILLAIIFSVIGLGLAVESWNPKNFFKSLNEK